MAGHRGRSKKVAHDLRSVTDRTPVQIHEIGVGEDRLGTKLNVPERHCAEHACLSGWSQSGNGGKTKAKLGLRPVPRDGRGDAERAASFRDGDHRTLSAARELSSAVAHACQSRHGAEPQPEDNLLLDRSLVTLADRGRASVYLYLDGIVLSARRPANYATCRRGANPPRFAASPDASLLN
jgi:hypothetical protein